MFLTWSELVAAVFTSSDHYYLESSLLTIRLWIRIVLIKCPPVQVANQQSTMKTGTEKILTTNSVLHLTINDFWCPSTFRWSNQPLRQELCYMLQVIMLSRSPPLTWKYLCSEQFLRWWTKNDWIPILRIINKCKGGDCSISWFLISINRDRKRNYINVQFNVRTLISN